jgi:Deacetylase PdaC/Protein of unknown function (DUF3298)
MHLKIILFLILAGSLSSCMWGVPHNNTTPAIAKDTLTYIYKTFKEKAPDCGTKPDSTCTMVTISYPVFTQQAILNDSIIKKLCNLFGDKYIPGKGIQLLADSLFAGYADFKKEDTVNTSPFTLNEKARVLRQDSALLTLEIDGEEYSGGAHGAEYISFINWNTKANKSIDLSDVLADGYNQKLTAIAGGIFRKQEKLSDTASLANDYFFENGKFSLAHNFVFTPLGIKFLYNDYEIKSYAAGQTELFVPYTQIRSLIKPNTVLSQYIK